MEHAVIVKDVKKAYKEFALDGVSFSVAKGTIMGLIGQNGAGKSTIIRLMLDLIEKDGGGITLLGKDSTALDKDTKEKIGVVMDECCFPESLTAKEINTVLRNTYKTWKQEVFFSYLKQFSLPDNKTVKEYSRGMKMKLSIAAALSHNTQLLILDEATSGLDPVVREEILDTFMAFIQDESHTLLMSSHIVSDLQKVCDYITFMHKGKIIFSEEKDRLLGKYAVLKCSVEEFRAIDRSAVVGQQMNMFGIEALVEKDKIPDGYILDKAGIEEIMLYYSKGEKQ